eukprot:TRINITY_DN5228_c2_g1_i6.p1 TRINITY_DN5228_c2_g1~~TRINITY_DN5228_c2_g1_i6.p1  ORF type:complete len:1030 (+),score=286.72 TRINITY_DN5228_c2_g1_i6:62-3091(+)
MHARVKLVGRDEAEALWAAGPGEGPVGRLSKRFDVREVDGGVEFADDSGASFCAPAVLCAPAARRQLYEDLGLPAAAQRLARPPRAGGSNAAYLVLDGQESVQQWVLRGSQQQPGLLHCFAEQCLGLLGAAGCEGLQLLGAAWRVAQDAVVPCEPAKGSPATTLQRSPARSPRGGGASLPLRESPRSRSFAPAGLPLQPLRSGADCAQLARLACRPHAPADPSAAAVVSLCVATRPAAPAQTPEGRRGSSPRGGAPGVRRWLHFVTLRHEHAPPGAGSSPRGQPPHPGGCRAALLQVAQQIRDRVPGLSFLPHKLTLFLRPALTGVHPLQLCVCLSPYAPAGVAAQRGDSPHAARLSLLTAAQVAAALTPQKPVQQQQQQQQVEQETPRPAAGAAPAAGSEAASPPRGTQERGGAAGSAEHSPRSGAAAARHPHSQPYAAPLRRPGAQQAAPSEGSAAPSPRPERPRLGVEAPASTAPSETPPPQPTAVLAFSTVSAPSCPLPSGVPRSSPSPPPQLPAHRPALGEVRPQELPPQRPIGQFPAAGAKKKAARSAAAELQRVQEEFDVYRSVMDAVVLRLKSEVAAERKEKERLAKMLEKRERDWRREQGEALQLSRDLREATMQVEMLQAQRSQLQGEFHEELVKLDRRQRILSERAAQDRRTDVRELGEQLRAAIAGRDEAERRCAQLKRQLSAAAEGDEGVPPSRQPSSRGPRSPRSPHSPRIARMRRSHTVGHAAFPGSSRAAAPGAARSAPQSPQLAAERRTSVSSAMPARGDHSPPAAQLPAASQPRRTSVSSTMVSRGPAAAEAAGARRASLSSTLQRQPSASPLSPGSPVRSPDPSPESASASTNQPSSGSMPAVPAAPLQQMRSTLTVDTAATAQQPGSMNASGSGSLRPSSQQGPRRVSTVQWATDAAAAVADGGSGSAPQRRLSVTPPQMPRPLELPAQSPEPEPEATAPQPQQASDRREARPPQRSRPPAKSLPAPMHEGGSQMQQHSGRAARRASAS